MRTTFDFAPLWRSTIGFDHLAGLVDSALRQATEDNYPPYNIERSGEDHYRITLAVAGFGADDIAVTAEQNALTIEGKKPEKAAGEFLYQGIAARPFRRIFNLADFVQVKQASFQDGLLIIDLVREVPEAMVLENVCLRPSRSSRQSRCASICRMVTGPNRSNPAKNGMGTESSPPSSRGTAPAFRMLAVVDVISERFFCGVAGSVGRSPRSTARNPSGIKGPS